MKKIEEMNIEELREEIKRAHADAECIRTLWQTSEEENKKMKEKLAAVKALASLL